MIFSDTCTKHDFTDYSNGCHAELYRCMIKSVRNAAHLATFTNNFVSVMKIFFTKVLFHYKMWSFTKILYYENLEGCGIVTRSVESVVPWNSNSTFKGDIIPV